MSGCVHCVCAKDDHGELRCYGCTTVHKFEPVTAPIADVEVTEEHRRAAKEIFLAHFHEGRWDGVGTVLESLARAFAERDRAGAIALAQAEARGITSRDEEVDELQRRHEELVRLVFRCREELPGRSNAAAAVTAYLNRASVIRAREP